MSPTFPEKCMRFLCQFFKTENSLTTTKVPPTTIKMFFKVINTVLLFSLPYTSEIDIENTFLYFFLFMYQAKFSKGAILWSDFEIPMDFQFQNASRSLLFSGAAWINPCFLFPTTWMASNVSIFRESDPSFLAGPGWKCVPTDEDCKSVMPCRFRGSF